MRPDRIVVGECRGGEALDLIQAMTSGHGGSLSTVHATYPHDTLHRLETLCLMSRRRAAAVGDAGADRLGRQHHRADLAHERRLAQDHPRRRVPRPRRRAATTASRCCSSGSSPASTPRPAACSAACIRPAPVPTFVEEIAGAGLALPEMRWWRADRRRRSDASCRRCRRRRPTSRRRRRTPTSASSPSCAPVFGNGEKKALPLYALPDQIVVGRGTACDWQLDDPSLSRKHCQFRWNGKHAHRRGPRLGQRHPRRRPLGAPADRRSAATTSCSSAPS